MTSEESGDDDAMIIHPLPWRSDHVNRMFSKIDGYIASKRSAQAKRQMKARKFGTPVPPANAPEWAVSKSAA